MVYKAAVGQALLTGTLVVRLPSAPDGKMLTPCCFLDQHRSVNACECETEKVLVWMSE